MHTALHSLFSLYFWGTCITTFILFDSKHIPIDKVTAAVHSTKEFTAVQLSLTDGQCPHHLCHSYWWHPPHHCSRTHSRWILTSQLVSLQSVGQCQKVVVQYVDSDCGELMVWRAGGTCRLYRAFNWNTHHYTVFTWNTCNHTQYVLETPLVIHSIHRTYLEFYKHTVYTLNTQNFSFLK